MSLFGQPKPADAPGSTLQCPQPAKATLPPQGSLSTGGIFYGHTVLLLIPNWC